MNQHNTDINLCIQKNLAQYFQDLEGSVATDVYNMVIFQVEKSMLSYVMEYCGNNQSKAAETLGLNRNTLRKKLLQHNLLP